MVTEELFFRYSPFGRWCRSDEGTKHWSRIEQPNPSGEELMAALEAAFTAGEETGVMAGLDMGVKIAEAEEERYAELLAKNRGTPCGVKYEVEARTACHIARRICARADDRETKETKK